MPAARYPDKMKADDQRSGEKNAGYPFRKGRENEKSRTYQVMKEKMTEHRTGKRSGIRQDQA